MESFENFDQQARSWEHLEQFGPALLAEARAVRAVHPKALVAGVIAEHGTPEYAELEEALRRSGMTAPSGPGFVGILPRPIVMDLIGDDGRTWVEDAAPVGSSKFPVVALLKDGFRFAALDLDE